VAVVGAEVKSEPVQRRQRRVAVRGRVPGEGVGVPEAEGGAADLLGGSGGAIKGFLVLSVGKHDSAAHAVDGGLAVAEGGAVERLVIQRGTVARAIAVDPEPDCGDAQEQRQDAEEDE